MSEIDAFLLLPMEAVDSFKASIGHGKILCSGHQVVVLAIPIILTGESEPGDLAEAISQPSRTGVQVGYLDRIRTVACEMSPEFAINRATKNGNHSIKHILQGDFL